MKRTMETLYRIGLFTSILMIAGLGRSAWLRGWTSPSPSRALRPRE